MSEEINVVIILRKPPHGTLFPVEGLRMAVAISADFEPTVIAIDDGVYTFIKNVDRTLYQMHLDFLKGIDIEIIIDKKSLDERRISKEDLIDDVIVKEHEEILKLLAKCDVAIPF